MYGMAVTIALCGNRAEERISGLRVGDGGVIDHLVEVSFYPET
jgi:hypothetical protein